MLYQHCNARYLLCGTMPYYRRPSAITGCCTALYRHRPWGMIFEVSPTSISVPHKTAGKYHVVPTLSRQVPSVWYHAVLPATVCDHRLLYHIIPPLTVCDHFYCTVNEHLRTTRYRPEVPCCTTIVTPGTSRVVPCRITGDRLRSPVVVPVSYTHLTLPTILLV